MCILPALNSVHKDTEGTSTPLTQTALTHHADTRTEPGYSLQNEHTPFRTPPSLHTSENQPAASSLQKAG